MQFPIPIHLNNRIGNNENRIGNNENETRNRIGSSNNNAINRIGNCDNETRNRCVYDLNDITINRYLNDDNIKYIKNHINTVLNDSIFSYILRNERQKVYKTPLHHLLDYNTRGWIELIGTLKDETSIIMHRKLLKEMIERGDIYPNGDSDADFERIKVWSDDAKVILNEHTCHLNGYGKCSSKMKFDPIANVSLCTKHHGVVRSSTQSDKVFNLIDGRVMKSLHKSVKIEEAKGGYHPNFNFYSMVIPKMTPDSATALIDENGLIISDKTTNVNSKGNHKYVHMTIKDMKYVLEDRFKNQNKLLKEETNIIN